MRAAPAVSCARSCESVAHEHTGQRRTSDIPCAMALRLISRSPRRIRAFVASVASRKPAPRPGRAFRTSARLDANHRGVGSTRFCRTLRHRSSTRSKDRSRSLSRPAIPIRARCRRVHRNPVPTFGDDGQRPSSRGETAVFMPLIWGKREAGNFRLSEILDLTSILKTRR